MTKSPIKSPDLKGTLTMEEFEDAVRQVLFSAKSGIKWENREPAKTELRMGYKLVKRKQG